MLAAVVISHVQGEKSMKTAIVLILALIVTLAVAGYTSSSHMPSTPSASPLASATSYTSTLELVSQIGEGGKAWTVAVQGNYAYLGLGSLLAVLDISSPATPKQVGSLWMPDYISSLAMSGDYVYVSSGEGGLRVVNISDPLHPIEVGSDTSSKGFGRIAIQGDYAYAAAYDYDIGLRVQVFDISDPTHPIAIGHYVPSVSSPSEAIRDMVIAGTYLYVAARYESTEWCDDDTSGLYIADISDPTAPVEVGSYKVSGCVDGIDAVRVVGNYAYVGSQIMDVSDPSHPVLAGSVAAEGDDIDVPGHYLYVLDHYGYVSKMDIITPTNPILIGSSGSNLSRQDIVVSGGNIYLPSGPNGLEIMDTSSFNTVGTYAIPGWVSSVDFEGNYAYAVTYNGLWIVDLSDPTRPTQVSLYKDTYLQLAFEDMEVAGNYAYVLAGNSLHIFDVSTPTTVTLKGVYYDSSADTRGVATANNYAYISSWNGIITVDISNPVSPTQVGFYEMPGAGDFVTEADYAYVVQSTSTDSPTRVLRILDISNPISLTETGHYSATSLQSIAVSGQYVYGIDASNELRVLDFSDKANPIEIGHYPILDNGPISIATLAGSYLYITAGDNGLRVLNISDSAHPTDAGSYMFAHAGVQGVAAANGYVYVGAGYEGGLITLHFSARNAISGRVFHSNGLPISGIVISASTTLITTTNASGAYVFNDLPYGTFTLTSTLPVYTFWPPHRTVSIPPDAHQDFLILSNPVSITLTPDLSGSLTYTDTQGLLTRIDFPAGAVMQTTTLTLTPTLVSKAGFAFSGHAFELIGYQEGNAQPALTFSMPATITIYYNQPDIRLVSDEDNLILWRWANNQQQDAALTCDPTSAYHRDLENHVLTLPVCRVGFFGLFGPTHQLYLPLVRQSTPFIRVK